MVGVGKKHRHQPAPFRGPDVGFDKAQYAWLNRQFYEGFDADLLQSRLATLCLMHDTPEVMRAHFTAGVTWDKLKFAFDEADFSDQKMQRQAEIELVALRQHAAEILFRNFHVHAAQDPCPWLALGRIRAPGDLKRLVDRYLKGDEWTDETSQTAYHVRAVWGTGAFGDDGSVKPELLEPSANIMSWIACAAMLVREAPLYNAYKHGLAIIPHEPFSLGFGNATADTPEIKIEAPSGFRYLDRMSNERERRHYWALVNEPIDFYEAACQTVVFGLILDGILTAGALDRRITQPPANLFVLNPELTPASVQTDSDSPYRLQRFCDSMAYFKQ